MYYRLLMPFQYEEIVTVDKELDKPKYLYICKYGNCQKEFTKAWNILDHVRMHEGIRPYRCDICSKNFTQRCNLSKHRKKHMKVGFEPRSKPSRH